MHQRLQSSLKYSSIVKVCLFVCFLDTNNTELIGRGYDSPVREEGCALMAGSLGLSSISFDLKKIFTFHIEVIVDSHSIDIFGKLIVCGGTGSWFIIYLMNLWSLFTRYHKLPSLYVKTKRSLEIFT